MLSNNFPISKDFPTSVASSFANYRIEDRLDSRLDGWIFVQPVPKIKGVKLIKLICACFLQFSCVACIMNNCCLHINKANSF